MTNHPSFTQMDLNRQKPQTQQHGATLMEFLVLTILILIFITLTINRIWELRLYAERVDIEQMIGTLKSALGTELAANVVKHGSQIELSRYNHCNPMTFLEPAPDNYLGEYATSPKKPVPGTWYFNRRDSTLNYRIHFNEELVSDNPEDPDLIRFQVQLEYNDLNHNGKFDPAIESASALNLVSLDKYHSLSHNKSD